MKKILLTVPVIALAMMSNPAFAKEYTIKEVSDPAGNKPYYFSPDKLTIQPGDTVTFINAQEDMHDVMFVEVPKGVDEMIMSPMHEKEGDKFSYTFTVPGTYNFHCHPHEALGMKGTLIVGQASKAGETVKMNHHKMGEKAEGKKADTTAVSVDTKSVQATGKINSVDLSKSSINITHDPIKALGWPKMKMEFPVNKNVDLSSIKAGDTVNFSLKPEGDENYIISNIKKK